MRKRTVFLLLALALLLTAVAVAWRGQAVLADTPLAGEPAEVAQNGDGAPGDEAESEPVQMVIAVDRVENGERTSGTVTVTFENPPELPQTAPDAVGLFLTRDGDQLTLGGPPIEVEADTEVINDQPPETTVRTEAQGATFTVRLTPDTVYYSVDSSRPEITNEDLAEGTLTVTRTAEPGNASDLGENVVMRVWGEEIDGVLTAATVVYEQVR